MWNGQKVSAVAGVGAMVIAVAVFAAAQPPGTPTPPGRSPQESVPKSDQHRIVGTVLHIDREQGLVKLATEEGVLVVQPSPPIVRAIRVGDTISVPRAAAEPVSALPRE